MQRILLTPGPLALSDTVKNRMLVDAGSRDDEFIRLTLDVRRKIARLAGGDVTHDTILQQGSGSFAVEAALTTFAGSQDRVLVCVNGLYGERMVTILRHNAIPHVVLRWPCDERLDVDQIGHCLDAEQNITHLCFVQCETTTGIVNPFAELVRVARSRGIVSIVDSMSALGALPVDLGSDGADVLVSSGNKCLEAPPGVAFAIVSRALLARGISHARAYSLDLLDQWRRFEADGEWRFTPPTHVVQALHQALLELEVEGVAQRLARYDGVRRRLVHGLAELDIVPVVDARFQSPICVAFRCRDLVPDATVFSRLYRHLAQRDLLIYARFHEQSESFRVGCIGRIADRWVDRLIEAVREFACAERASRSRQSPLVAEIVA